ncbi:uncharacterized protein LOC130612678 [Hydractinia symbiolongicarpus]|uniref:uncharacterized protein LOC130612678 n=1 Tax=Hydractinia symbiolongicarpus TaxID=13093 RepID=UPI002550B4E1|nr:uncharacterized protein LOC130612678 [Hydractinia symbiolongicarpus]
MHLLVHKMRCIILLTVVAVALGQVCQDKNPRYCYRKSYCSRNYMKIYCAKFCGFCDDSGTGGTGTGGGTQNVKDECLNAHNNYRRKHRDTPDLVWDAQLAKGAEDYAKELLRRGGLSHSKGNYGENLYQSYGYGSSGACKAASDSWYDEIKLYDFNKPGYKKGIGHFTQMVWKSSTKLGVGVASKGRTVVVVARYTPQGNFLRRFEQNVMRLK